MVNVLQKSKQDLCNELIILDRGKADWHFKEDCDYWHMDLCDEFRIYKNDYLVVEYVGYEGYYLSNIKNLSPDEVYLIARWLEEANNYMQYSEEEILRQKEG